MNFFVEGLLAGYGIAIPVGAVAVLIIEMGMRCGLKVGFSAGAGAATADVIYATVVVLTGTVLVQLLIPIASILQIFSALLLVGIGSWGLWRGLKRGSRSNKTAEVCGVGRMFVQFLGITIVNPLTIVYFAALILGSDSIAMSSTDKMVFVLGVGVASLSWQSFLATIGSLGHRTLSPRFQVGAIVIGNIVVIGLGLRIIANLNLG